MAAATAFCTSNTAFYQHTLATGRAQYPSAPRRSPHTTLSSSPSSSPTTSSAQFEQTLSTHQIKSDENNNHPREIAQPTITDLDDVLYITSDDDEDEDDINEDENFNGDRTECDIDQARFLSMVGLRMKNKRSTVPTRSLRPLTKRLACPVCLLPLPKHIERVRQALHLRLPSLKFLKFTRDIDRFCSTDENARAKSLLPRSLSQTRTAKTIKKNRRKQKLSKAALINLATDAIVDLSGQHSMDQYVHSILQCHVALDRMEQSAIDHLMQDPADSQEERIVTTSTENPSSRANRPSTRFPSVTTTQAMTSATTTTSTTIMTISTEKTLAKRKSPSAGVNTSKRFKATHRPQSPSTVNEASVDALSSPYKRIYLKCFVCSKRDYIDAEAPNSDALHSHWLDHAGDLSLNIYDAEIDSILTRVVEFFNSPKQHTLEGKIKTVFILNSREIRHASINDSSPTGSFIVID